MTASDRPPSETGDRLLPWKQVKAITGLSRTTCWRLQKAGDFPAPLVISPGRVGWRAGDVAAWTASRTPRGTGDRRAGATPPPQRPLPDCRAAAPPRPPPVERPLRPRRARRRPDKKSDQLGFDF